MSAGIAVRRSHTVGALGALSGAALALAVILLIGTRSEPPAEPAVVQQPLPPVVSPAGLAKHSGVRVTQLATTGGGGLLDLRYQVIDPGKAAAIHDLETPPALVDERTGVVIDDLFMGHSHNGPTKAGLIYYLVFSNPGSIVQSGDRVSVVLGDARIAHVRVL